MKVQDIEGPEDRQCSRGGVYHDDGKEDMRGIGKKRTAEMQKEIHPNTSLP